MSFSPKLPYGAQNLGFFKTLRSTFLSKVLCAYFAFLKSYNVSKESRSRCNK